LIKKGIGLLGIGFISKTAGNMRFRQEATSHWRRDIKTPALREINLESAKRNNYSNDNQNA